MHDAEFCFGDNPLNRCSLSQRNKLETDADGSVEQYIQCGSPGKEKESNRLPAPTEKFVLMLRMYGPQETPRSTLDDTWKIPPVREAN